jgi:hypothetical protein
LGFNDHAFDAQLKGLLGQRLLGFSAREFDSLGVSKLFIGHKSSHSSETSNWGEIQKLRLPKQKGHKTLYSPIKIG